jgi:glutaredoxin
MNNNKLGSLTHTVEARNNPKAISSGKFDKGGKSYGLNQLTSLNMKKFLEDNEHYKDKLPHEVGTEEFDKSYKMLADTDPEFLKAQDIYNKKNNFEPVVNTMADTLGDLANDKLVQELMHSTSTQLGPGRTKRFLKEIQPELNTKQDLKEALKYIQQKKIEKIPQYFESSPNLHKGIKNRYETELQEIIKQLQNRR